MKNLALALCLVSAAPSSWAQQTTPSRKPKLILAVIVDQFRLDYFYRFAAQYNSGLARLASQGAFFTNAHYEHFPTVTAVGHSTFLSGATPSVSGIIANDWYDRGAGKQVTSVEDAGTKLLGGSTATGSSPGRLLVSTIADQLKMSGRSSKAIGISIKDRSAILPVGRMADAAYWFDNKTGNFVSSTYYFADLPAWVKEFNASRITDRYLDREWVSIEDSKILAFGKMPAAKEEKYWAEMQRTPFGNEILEEMAEQAIDAEKLGADEITDVLSVSFSSNDYVGHEFGPDDPRVRDIAIRTDRTLGRLFAFLDKKVGMANVLVVMSADHGVAPVPEKMKERKMPGGRLSDDGIKAAVRDYLNGKYGTGGEWLPGKNAYSLYLNLPLIHAKGLDPKKIRGEVADVVREIPHIYRVLTSDQLAAGQGPGDVIDLRIRNGFYAPRAADVTVVTEPYYVFEKTGTSHGTPFNYDSHVPLVMMGPGIRPGRYHRRAAVNDLAPTLATLLEVEVPSGANGRVLDEALR